MLYEGKTLKNSDYYKDQSQFSMDLRSDNRIRLQLSDFDDFEEKEPLDLTLLGLSKAFDLM